MLNSLIKMCVLICFVWLTWSTVLSNPSVYLFFIFNLFNTGFWPCVFTGIKANIIQLILRAFRKASCSDNQTTSIKYFSMAWYWAKKLLILPLMPGQTSCKENCFTCLYPWFGCFSNYPYFMMIGKKTPVIRDLLCVLAPPFHLSVRSSVHTESLMSTWWLYLH